MPIDAGKYREVLVGLGEKVKLVAVSKTKPAADITALYDLGQRDFGENYVQELVDKQPVLPPDIRWHFIGHLQSNKVKYIAPFVHLIHGVDSLRLLKEIDKQAARSGRVITCLLQVYIAREETKFGLDEQELAEVMESAADLKNIRIAGLMGMASFTEDLEKVRSEFHTLKIVFDKYFPITVHSSAATLSSTVPAADPASTSILSMGMSADYRIAIEEGSNMVRIGSLLFGKRG